MAWNRARSTKYGAKRTTHSGYSFASKMEAALYDLLNIRKIVGEIKEIKCQSTIYLTDARIIYKPDFECVMPNDTTEWFECKGFETTDWRIKRRLWLFYGPGLLHIYKGNASRLYLDETLIVKRS